MSDLRSFGRITHVRGALATAHFGKDGFDETRPSNAGTTSQARVGDLIRITTPSSIVYGLVSGLSATAFDEDALPLAGTMDIDLIGECLSSTDGPTSGFQRGISFTPALGTEVHAATNEDAAIVFAAPTKAHFQVGTIHQTGGITANLVIDDLLNKHFAILGTTGSGKSCATTLILRAILDTCPNGHIIVLDPHNEYITAFGDQAESIQIDNLHLPYWMLIFDELKEILVSQAQETRDSEIRILKSALLKARKDHPENETYAGYITVDTPVPFRLSALKRILDDEMGNLNKADNSSPYLRLLARLDTLTTDRRYAFMFSTMMVRDILPDILSRFLRIPVAGKPVTLIDLSGVPAEITDVVVSVLCRTVFDFALWSKHKQQVPVLLVCEEAHRYIPEEKNAGFEPTKRAIGQIAKEGRKYGVSLCLVSQRPSELSSSILSQCGTLVSLRMGNEQDLAFVRGALPEGSSSLLSVLPALRLQEAVIVGEGVSVPVRVKLNTLNPEHLPRSGSAPFSSAWQGDDLDDGLVSDTVHGWRLQTHS